ncbi:MAG: hypothetical protein ABIH22_04685 [Candidatus Margulisiibacteriota bacterium]
MKRLISFGLASVLVFGIIVSQAAAQWIEVKNDIYYIPGRVGIGVEKPVYKLHVNDPSFAIFGLAESNKQIAKTGVMGKATGLGPVNRGVFAETVGGSMNMAVYAHAGGGSGKNYAVYALTDMPNSYSGYFKGGKNYFEGNVGIGTENPTAALDVKGTVKADKFVGNFVAIGKGVWDSTNNANIYRTTGNVGIGTMAPTEKLEVIGKVKADELEVVKKVKANELEVVGTVKADKFVGDGSGLKNIAVGGASLWKQEANSIYYMGDKVGIGTDKPLEELHVVGGAKIEGKLFVNEVQVGQNTTLINEKGVIINDINILEQTANTAKELGLLLKENARLNKEMEELRKAIIDVAAKAGMKEQEQQMLKKKIAPQAPPVYQQEIEKQAVPLDQKIIKKIAPPAKPGIRRAP